MYTSLMLAVALSVAAPKPKEEPKKEMPKLEGEWAVESFDGAPKKEEITMVRFQFVDGKILIHEPKRNRPEEAAYTADYTKKIGEIDIRPLKGMGMPSEEVVKGIFEIKGDTLKICFGKGNGLERPTEFKGELDKNIILITLKRVKEEKK